MGFESDFTCDLRKVHFSSLACMEKFLLDKMKRDEGCNVFKNGKYFATYAKNGGVLTKTKLRGLV
ncbi:MAG: hypothetical protein Q4F84_01100 [Fibrobacter sp.]|nr:hypothetical protein [Fibrobacter sp.]